MIHGGFGLIDEYAPGRHALFLPSGVLNTLNIIDGMRLYGVYHSKEENHGFVLTSIPFDYWPQFGRFVIRIRHGTIGIQEISKHLSATTSILFSEAARLSYSFDTWNLTVGLDSLEGADSTDTRMKQLKQELLQNEDFNKYLYYGSDKCEPVQVIQHTALPHFAEKYKDPRARKFPLDYHDRDGTLYSKDFAYIVEGILAKSEKRAFVFGGADAREMTIRVLLVPPERQNRFFVARYSYKSTKQTTKGILPFVLKELSEKRVDASQDGPQGAYLIWGMANHTLQKLPYGEDGSTSLIIEDSIINRDKDGDKEGASGTEKMETLSPDIKAQKILNNISLPSELGRLLPGTLKAEPVTVDTIRNRMRWSQAKYTYDVFLSYDHEDQSEADKIKAALTQTGQRITMAKRFIKIGSNLMVEIRQAIRDSREVCILVTQNALASCWVITEYGIGIAYEKPIACIRGARCSHEDASKVFGSVDYSGDINNLEQYVYESLKRKAEDETNVNSTPFS